MPVSADTIILKLRKIYPDAKIYLKFNTPIQLLVATMLSARSTDTQVNELTKTLFIQYKTVDDFANESLLQFEKKIRSCGLYKTKAKNIIAAAKIIRTRFKSKLPKTIDEMVILPGVGRKTANIVLFNAYGNIEGIAVDTHVKRLSKRLSLTGQTDPGNVEKDLMRQFSKKYWNDLNLLFIAHGRAICTARSPKCRDCCLGNNCSYFKEIS